MAFDRICTVDAKMWPVINMSSPQISRHLGLSNFAAVRTRRVTASPCHHARVLGYRKTRCNQRHSGEPLCRPGTSDAGSVTA